MINDLMELNDFVVSFCNQVVHRACESTTSGQYYVNIQEILDANKWGYDDFLEYKDLILNELGAREELLDFDYLEDSFEIDINCGLSYCPAYQWCDGDEEIFNCSFEEWLKMPVKPITDRPTYSQLLDDFSVKSSITPVYFYVGDGVKIDKDFTSLDDALKEFDFFVKKGNRICLGIVCHGEAEVLLDNACDRISLNKEALKDVDKDLSDTLNSYMEEKYPANDFLVGKWRVHVIAPGMLYGRDDCLIYKEKESCIEFWDMSQDRVRFPNGQFTGGRYYIETLLEDKWGPGPEQLMRGGLQLDGDVPDWYVSGDEMRQVFAWLKCRELLPGEHYCECHGEIDLSMPVAVLDNVPASRADSSVAAGEYIINQRLEKLACVRDISIERMGVSLDGKDRLAFSFISQAGEYAIDKALSEAFSDMRLVLDVKKKTVEHAKDSLDKIIEECAGQMKKEPGVGEKDKDLER